MALPVNNPHIGLGSYVKTRRYGQLGRVYQVHTGCPEDREWRDLQTFADDDPDPGFEMGRWLSILVHNGGSVVVPDWDVVEVVPFELDNTWGNYHFGVTV